MQQIIPQVDQFLVNNKRLVGAVALLAAAKVSFNLLSSVGGFVKREILPGYNLENRYGKGSYVAISACTDGIGKGFALSFAKRGFNLVMLIRNEEKGKELINFIKTTINPNIDIKIVVVDFVNSLQPGVIQAVVDQLKDIDISILVNNVGTFIHTPSFELIPEKDLINLISMNVGAQTLLTNKLIKQLRKRSKRSAIINLSSISSTHPITGMAVYGASKSYNDYLSRTLTEEYGDEIDVLSVKPGFVSTPLTSAWQKKDKPFEITVDQCVESTLSVLGRETTTFGHILHQIAGFNNHLVKSINKKYQSVMKSIRK